MDSTGGKATIDTLVLHAHGDCSTEEGGACLKAVNFYGRDREAESYVRQLSSRLLQRLLIEY